MIGASPVESMDRACANSEQSVAYPGQVSFEADVGRFRSSSLAGIHGNRIGRPPGGTRKGHFRGVSRHLRAISPVFASFFLRYPRRRSCRGVQAGSSPLRPCYQKAPGTRLDARRRGAKSGFKGLCRGWECRVTKSRHDAPAQHVTRFTGPFGRSRDLQSS